MCFNRVELKKNETYLTLHSLLAKRRDKIKKINVLVLIGVLLILTTCSKEKTVQEENQSEVAPIESTYKDEAICISILAEKERYDQ